MALDLDSEEAAELAHRDVVERFGFALSEVDEALVVTAVPAILGRVDPRVLLSDLAGSWRTVAARLARALDAVAAGVSRFRAAQRGGDSCADGRPRRR